jgi:hypothetical protein
MSFADVTEIRPGHGFDVSRLASYLAGHIEGLSPNLTVRQFRGGQSNPTFLIESGASRYVLRKKPSGQLLPSAHMIEREYRVMHALRDTGVPVIPTRLLCEDSSVIGTSFYLSVPKITSAHIDGVVRTRLGWRRRVHTAGPAGAMAHLSGAPVECVSGCSRPHTKRGCVANAGYR